MESILPRLSSNKYFASLRPQSQLKSSYPTPMLISTLAISHRKIRIFRITSWQIAWAEAFLSADGQQLLVERVAFDELRYTARCTTNVNARSAVRSCALRVGGLISIC